MHNPFDQLAKILGKGALDACGLTIIQREIFRDAQHADLLHEPDPARDAERARLGLLGRIAAVVCLIEIYGHAPDGAEFRACLSKHLAFWEERERRKRARRTEACVAAAAPFLWILAAGRPEAVLAALEVTRRRGWPKGVYFCGNDIFRIGIVVASELPRERSTLLVRLMTAGPRLPEAVEDLAGLPGDAYERAVAEQILLRLQCALGKKSNRTPEEEEFIVRMQNTWAKARELGRDEGRAAGRDEGRAAGRDEGRAEEAARAVLAVLRVRGLTVPDAARERILAEKDPGRLQRWHERAILAASVAEMMDEPS
jgi:hypothetical protein